MAAAGYNVTLIVQSERDHVRYGVDVKSLSGVEGRTRRMTVRMVQAARIALAKKADVYHLHDPELLPLGLVLRALGRRVVYDMHENLPEQIRRKHWIPMWSRAPLAAAVRVFERLALGGMAVVMAERSYARSYRWVRRQEVVLNFPLADELQELAAAQLLEKPTIGYIGGVTQDRGVLKVMESAQRIRQVGFPLEFECIGEISPEVANDIGFQRAVDEGWLRAPGRMSPRDGWPRIARCHVGVALLRPVGNYVESYPTKMFEYMAMGIPVVVSNFPLYRDVVERHTCGVCVDPDDEYAIVDALRFLLKDPERAAEMGKNGQKAALAHYNWRHELEKLIAFYRSLT